MSNYVVFSLQELEKLQDLIEDYNYFNRLLLVNPRDKKASNLVDKSLFLIVSLINPKNRVVFNSVNDIKIKIEEE